MLAHARPGERVAFPAVAYALVNECGHLAERSAPGDAVVTDHQLFDQGGLRGDLAAVLGGVEHYAHMDGLVAVCGRQPWRWERPNVIGRLVVVELGGRPLLAELYGPVAFVRVDPGEDATAGLDPERSARISRAFARVVADQSAL